MPTINFPTAAQNPAAAGVLALAKVYIGAIDLDPRTLGNRINVTVIQEDGTPVVIAPAAQPLILNAGGMFTYNGSTVILTAATAYAMAVDTAQDVQVYYLPNSSVSSSDVDTSVVVLNASGSDPAPIAAAGQLFTKTVGGITEFFYIDSEGQAIQFTQDGALKVTLPDAVLDVLAVTATGESYAGYFTGAVQNLTITGGEIEIDWHAGQYFSYTNTETHTITFSNMPLIDEGKGQTIMLAIQDAGNFGIQFDFSLGYNLYRRAADPWVLTTDGLDLIIATVYASGIIAIVPLLDFVPDP